MLELRITATSAIDLKSQMEYLLRMYSQKPIAEEPPLVEVPVTEEPVREPVITQAQMEENVKNAPVHEEPQQPTIEEVRAAMKALRDKKGAGAVRELLKAFNADSLPDLKQEDYLGAFSRAMMEVE